MPPPRLSPKDQDFAPRGRDRRPVAARRVEAPAKPWTRRHERLNALGWSLTGFIVGAAFWHFIGFWNFLGNVVLNGSSDRLRPTVAEAPAWQADVRPQANPTPTRPVAFAKKPAAGAAAACSALVRDPVSGETSAQPCPGSPAVLATAGSEKADLAVAEAAPPAVRAAAVAGAAPAIKVNPDGSAVATWASEGKPVPRR
jgi:hypothetical protein